jgi:hypothetical protein
MGLDNIAYKITIGWICGIIRVLVGQNFVKNFGQLLKISLI